MSDTTPPPASAIEHCRAVTRRRAGNFYLGLRLLPEPRRSALYTVYAWMRIADDITDDEAVPIEARRARLEAFAVRTRAALAGADGDDDPVWTALAWAVRRFDLPAQPFADMLHGMRDDLDGLAYPTFADLRLYCERVASSVGVLCVHVWGFEDRRAPRLAAERGIALQLTNILRDVAADHDAGRVYLPAEDFEAFGLDPDALRRWARPEDCRELILLQVERARGFYDASATLTGMIDARCRPTLRTMTGIYRVLLERIARDPQRIVRSRRVRVPALVKAAIVITARWRETAPRPEHA